MRAAPLGVAFVLFVCSLVGASGESPTSLQPKVIAQRRRPPSTISAAGPDIAQRAVIDDEEGQEQLQVSITPRVNVVQAPVDSNAILKCLISAQTNKFTQVFRVSWSRRRHSESQYEQLESENYNGQQHYDHDGGSSVTKRVLNVPALRGVENSAIANGKRQVLGENSSRESFEAPNRMQQLRDFLARTRQETNVISELLVEATLSINSVKPSDNASYFCTASVNRRAGAIGASQEARIELLVLSRPQVRLERVLAARDSKSALVVWTIVSDGNAHIKKTILMVRNDSQVVENNSNNSSSNNNNNNNSNREESQPGSSLVLDADHRHWQRIDIQGEGQRVALASGESAVASDLSDNNIVRADVDVTSIDLSSQARSSSDFTSSSSLDYNERAYNLSSLLPGVTYQLKLAASNDLGQSSWSELSTSMPNEIPAQISDVRVLGQTNDSITIGWRRPAYDRARTLRYEMQLFDLNRTLTLDANTNTTISAGQPARTNFMFHFVNLNPGTDYHFHIRACSRAGCSAYSRPKLLASTQDGEPEEPLEVELSCELSTNQLMISWSAPRVTRGKLRAYTVELEARARFRNQSGSWTSDEWRRQFETADNQSLSFEPNSLPGALQPLVSLQPNTNYTARVCAQNRARKCGRWSSQSSLAKSPSCSTPVELPRELPANIRLSLKQIKTTQVGAQRPQAETLVLELPFISARNGSIDCLQIVLIRLPAAFDLATRPLSDYLPDDPADLQPHHFLEQLHHQNHTSALATAYLADELDQVSQSGSSEELASGLKQILLGDGQHSHCSQVWAKLRNNNSSNNNNNNNNNNSLPLSKHSLQPMDGPLSAQTYYSGFLRLVQVRPMLELRNNVEIMQQRSRRAAHQLSMRYSNYFSPVKTSDLVPEVSMDLLAASNSAGDLEQVQQNSEGEQADSSTKSTFCDHQLIVDIQSQLNTTTRPCQLVVWLTSRVKKLAISAYKLTVQVLSEHVHLERLEQLISRSSAPLQLLQIGLLVFLVSLGLLFMVYLLLLPSRTLKRNRKRKLKQKQQAEQQQQRQPEVQKVINNMEQVDGEDDAGFERRKSQQQQEIVHQQQQNMRALASSLGYQQVNETQAYGTLKLDPAACPIHSSPMSQQATTAHNDDDNEPLANRRQSVHVCQPNPQYHYHHNHYGHVEQTNGHQHQHQHHHHQSANQLAQQADELPRWQAHDGDRNCRTMRRAHNQNANYASHEQQQQPPQRHQSIQSNGQLAHAGRQAMNPGYTMTMQGDPLLALAKKINKSIPLALFQQVLEVRLKNNWLREEYEQLPRLASSGENSSHKQLAMSKSPGDSGRHIKLRPQLIVSRDDSISALISGNDYYDGSLVKLQLPSVSSGTIERQFICAKSPVDPDSVWDFWRLVYEREVGALVMLTPNEDTHTGELRCAQYWPTCDNEETTILSPCNEYVQQSDILPAKFKIRQETLEPSGDSAATDSACEFKIRRLTLLVMATRPSENEHPATPTNEDHKPSEVNGTGTGSGERESSVTRQSSSNHEDGAANGIANEDDDEELVIIERHLLHFQFLHWNAASASNQMRLIKFIELVNERHSRQCQLQASPGAHQWQQVTSQLPILVHCANGIGRSGLFTAMSYLIDDLSLKLSALSAMATNNNNNRNNQQLAAKLNLFQLVGRLRNQRDMLLSPYRFYEQLYQLTARCIPVQRHVRDRELHIARHE